VNPRLRKAEFVRGRTLAFRNARVEDAPFILSLRTNRSIARYLARTSEHLSDQIDWLNRYAHDEQQCYFIIEDLDRRQLGTVRLYDADGVTFTWGSWIMCDEAPTFAAVESMAMVYLYAKQLGFARAAIDVRRGNRSVWRFHEWFGAQRIGETELDYLYLVTPEGIESGLGRTQRLLPEGITITWPSSDEV
jgi:hypothetical protein